MVMVMVLNSAYTKPPSAFRVQHEKKGGGLVRRPKFLMTSHFGFTRRRYDRGAIVSMYSTLDTKYQGDHLRTSHIQLWTWTSMQQFGQRVKLK